MTVNYIYFVGAFAAIYSFFALLLWCTQDRREPRALETWLPFLAPVIGTSRHKTNFYVRLRDKFRLPIYTLRMPGSRLYIVNSPRLISEVQKQHRVLAFMPLVAKASVSVSQFSKIAAEIINTNTNGEEGNWGYVMTFHDAILPTLAPGRDLDAMNRVMLGCVALSLNQLKQKLRTRTRLFEWVTTQITLATTSAAYGPHNPYRDPSTTHSFWTFKAGMTNLILGMTWTKAAKEATQSMSSGAKAFERYFTEDHHLEGSALTRARFTHSSDHHIPLNDIARSEFANGIALLSNTVPNAFWLLYHIYSAPGTLAACRKEVSAIVSTTETRNKQIRTVDMTKVKHSCPTLFALYKEVLRFYSTAVSARLVMQDHMLDSTYLLKKGSTVIMPTPVQHRDEALWGPHKDSFDHRRFLGSDTRLSQPGFRAFGGGTTLCPGRHFATTEILAFVAVMIVQFEVRPSSGKWPQVSADKVEFWEATPSPDADVEVDIEVRTGDVEGCEWEFILSDSERPLLLSAEDGESGGS